MIWVLVGFCDLVFCYCGLCVRLFAFWLFVVGNLVYC